VRNVTLVPGVTWSERGQSRTGCPVIGSRNMGYLRYGVGTARRGWLTPGDVINTWPLPRLRAFLRKGR
jgi:hypothetical protein